MGSPLIINSSSIDIDAVNPAFKNIETQFIGILSGLIAAALYFVHVVLTGLSLFIAATFQWTAGFGFSAGLVDLVLSFNLPLVNQPFMLIVQGLVFAAIYYFLFRFIILKFDLKNPGRGDVSLEKGTGELDDVQAQAGAPTDYQAGFRRQAQIILDGLGRFKNIKSLDNCVSRLHLEIVDMDKIDAAKIKSAGIPAINKVSDTNLHLIVGTEVQFVADEMAKLK